MTTTNNSNDRMMKGMAIAEKKTIAENADGSFAVPSQTVDEIVYRVHIVDNIWACNCPDHTSRKVDCKHIHATRIWIASRTEIENKPKPKVFAEGAVQCECGSIRVVKFGHANGKQIFKCRDCGKKFRESLLRKSRYTPETIALTLDLYFSGDSLTKIARILNSHLDMHIGKATVYRWIQRYVPQISEYVNSLSPQLSDTWQADEVFVKMKGGERVRKMDGMAYLWNVMDRKTRFLLASRLSQHRNVNGAVGAFNEARKVAHDSQPEKIFADGLNAYPQAMTYWESESGRPELVARMGVGKPHANNNRIERMNGTLRERIKIQRGWKTMKTPLAEGQRIHYNFVKPHMALEGQTPAQASGLAPKGWRELLAQALEASTRSSTMES